MFTIFSTLGGQRCFQNSRMQQVVVEVNLFDTSGESDIDIGTLLVMQGAADWSEEGESIIEVSCSERVI